MEPCSLDTVYSLAEFLAAIMREWAQGPIAAAAELLRVARMISRGLVLVQARIQAIKRASASNRTNRESGVLAGSNAILRADWPSTAGSLSTKETIVKRKFVMTMTAGTWLAFSALAGAQSAGAPPAAASAKDQHVISTQDLELLRQDIRSHKKQMIAQNLNLTDTDATKFWPIYDKYTAELAKINDKKYAAFQEYADHWGTLSDDQSVALIKQFQDVDIQAAQLRAKYLPIVAQAIGGHKAATFAQLDRRISMLIDLQLASKVPLIQSQNKNQ